MKGLTRIAIVALVGFALAAAAPLASAAEGAKPRTVTPDQLKWSSVSGMPGATAALVWGESSDRHAVFMKLPAGFSAALHTHTSGARAVVVSGTVVLVDDAGKETKLPAGSFFTTPAAFKHGMKCLAGADCLLYSASEGKWDFNPAKK